MATSGHSETFARREQSYLSAVEHVTLERIYYTGAFKKECTRRYRSGEPAVRIFKERLASVESQLESLNNEKTPGAVLP